MTELERLHEMIESLKAAAASEGLDSLMDQLVSLEIETMALSVMAHRRERMLEQILQIKLPELKRRVSLPGLEILGYYALPREMGATGNNEPPVGPEHIRELRGQVFAIFNECFEEAISVKQGSGWRNCSRTRNSADRDGPGFAIRGSLTVGPG